MAAKILVVDDESDILELLRARLENSGYSIITASTGHECIKKAEEENPDVILLDVLLSGQSGFEVCKLLKKSDRTKNIPVIMVTALFGESAQQHKLECGAEYLISKPFDPEDLLSEIENVLKR